MANRYWVGGTDNWNATAGTKWATTSGGAGGSAVPTSSDDVFFDASSGAVTITLTGTGNCLNFNTTGFTGTFTINSSLNIYGSVTLGSGMTFSGSSSSFALRTTGSSTITSNGKIFPRSVNFQGTGTYTLLDDFTVASTAQFLLTSGTFDANNFNVSSGNYVITGSTARTLTMGSGTWSSTQSTTSIGGVTWDLTNTTNLTFNAGTSTIKIDGAIPRDLTFSGGGLTYYNFWDASTGGFPITFTGDNTFNDFKVSSADAHTVYFTTGSKQIVSTFTVSGVSGDLISLDSAALVYTSTTTWTCPTGITSILVRLWGGGGAGGGSTTNPGGGGGGAGGQYVEKIISVTAGNTYDLTRGAGGTGSTGDGTAGGDTIFSLTGSPLATAKGGAPGIAFQNGGTAGVGSTTGGDGDTVRKGGDGAAGTTGLSGGGAGGAGTTADGGNASGVTAGTGATLSGGNGGTGRTTSVNGGNGSAAGGGGGGGFKNSATSRSGGNGGVGRIEILAAHMLSKASGTVSSDYLSISNSTAMGGAAWFAGNNSIDGGSNSGWIFPAPPSTRRVFIIT